MAGTICRVWRTSPRSKASRRRPIAIAFLLVSLSSLNVLAAPRIRHSPPQPKVGTDLLISAKITAPGGVLEPSLYFRKGDGPYTRLAMDASSGNVYEAHIPAAFLEGSDHIEYYLGAYASKDLSQAFWRSKEAPFKLSLKPETEHQVHVTTTPPSAIIDVDGVTAGPSPYNAALPAGRHHLSARLTGFARLDFDFTMPKDKDLDLPLPLQPDHDAASGPSPSTAATSAATPPTSGAAAPPASHPPAAAPSGPVTSPAPASSPPPATQVAATSPGKGHVRIVTTPPGAAITVDGRDVGTSPIELDLDPSSYLVTARLGGRQTETRIIKLTAGETTERTIPLRAELR
jgi:hypothetical protein